MFLDAHTPHSFYRASSYSILDLYGTNLFEYLSARFKFLYYLIHLFKCLFDRFFLKVDLTYHFFIS